MTRADRSRICEIKEGRCVACWVLGRTTIGCDAHHMLSGGRRIGHEATVALCAWHHRAVPDPGETAPRMALLYGPSLIQGSKPFRAAYGTDAQLLEIQEQMLRGEV
jgi:hypothetical protein